MRTTGFKGFMGVLLLGTLLLNGCGRPPGVQAARSIDDFTGEWKGNSQAGAPLRVVVQSGKFTFWYHDALMNMKEPVLESDGALRIDFRSSGYIRLTILEAGSLGPKKVAWLYNGSLGHSEAILVPERQQTAIR